MSEEIILKEPFSRVAKRLTMDEIGGQEIQQLITWNQALEKAMFTSSWNHVMKGHGVHFAREKRIVETYISNYIKRQV